MRGRAGRCQPEISPSQDIVLDSQDESDGPAGGASEYEKVDWHAIARTLPGC